jgi:hypothetical protein
MRRRFLDIPPEQAAEQNDHNSNRLHLFHSGLSFPTPVFDEGESTHKVAIGR